MIRKGDILTFGQQRLMCGDSRDPVQVARLLGDVEPSIMFTSPPYLSQRVYAEAIGEWLPMMIQATLAPKLADDAQIFVNLGLCHKDGEWVPYWEPWLQAVRKHGWRRFQLCIWDKREAYPGDFAGRLAPGYEFIFHLNKKAVRVNKTLPTKFAGAQRKNRRNCNSQKSEGRPNGNKSLPTQSHKIMRNIIPGTPVKERGLSHPAMMGLEMPLRLLDGYAQLGGVVYDCFCGSGTTLVACHRLGLRGFGMEQSAEYCEIAAERLAKEMA